MSEKLLLNWLINFLRQRKLKEPTGKMLFSYQATATEYQELGKHLRVIFCRA
jgi:hypothetical protein